MTYEDVITRLDKLDFLYSYDINYGKEYIFGLSGTFSVKILKTFLTEGFAVFYNISHYGRDFSFEEFYDRMPTEMQERIIYNLDVFIKMNANQCCEEDRQNIIAWVEVISEEYNSAFDNMQKEGLS